MCEYCEEVKLKQCTVLVEDKIGIRSKTDGKLDFIPTFKEMYVPLNYCPKCGRKL